MARAAAPILRGLRAATKTTRRWSSLVAAAKNACTTNVGAGARAGPDQCGQRSTGSSPAVLIFLLLPMPLQPQLYQAFNKIGIRHTRSRPQLGIHADGGESRHGIDLV